MPVLRTLAPASLLATTLGLAACGDDPLEVPRECNPLGDGESCMMPWPSSAYLTEDPSTATGYRLDIPREAMPINTNNVVVEPTPYNTWDGFSMSGPMVAMFPGGVSAEGLPPHTDPGQSLADGSSVVVVNMDTGERALVFAEVDMNSEDPAMRALIIRPLRRLDAGARYAVGITTAVKSASGGDLPVPPAFAALRDGTGYRHPRFDAVQPRYDAIFAALEDEGVSRDELVLAWDFVTASEEMMTSDLMTMRTAALAAMGEAGANLGHDLEEFPGDGVRTHKLIAGTIESPDFLTGGETLTSVLRRDASGRPELSGMRDANFAAIIPQCVTTAQLPVPVMLFGHGLFGSGEDYLTGSLLQRVAEDYCFVVVAGDFIGLTGRDIGTTVTAANDLNYAGAITEKLAQSIIDFISIEHIVRGPLRTDPMFSYQGNPVIDPTQVYYFGASLGGNMGGTFMAYDPYITRGVLGVGGGPWSMLFERSFAWNALKGPAQASYPDPANFQIMISMLGMRFDPYDQATTAPHLIQDPLPGTPVKQILLYETIGDSLVSNLASETYARSMGLPVVMPSLKQPYGLQAGIDGGPNGFAIYDEDPAPLPPEVNQPPEEDNGTHSDVHERPAVLRQIEGFLYDGVVNNECRSGETAVACNCADGACE